MAVYWGIKHEEFCKSWLTAGVKDQFKIYHQLHGVLYMMSEIIANRYFSIPNSRQAEYIDLVINEVFLKLSKFNPNTGTAYTFCSMVIKHKYYDMVKNKGIKEIQLEFIDDYTSIDTDKSIYDQKEEIDVETISKRLEALRTEHIEMLTQTGDRYHKINIHTQKQLILIIDKCQEYLLRFENFNSDSIYEYVVNNTVINSFTLTNCFYKLFGISIAVDKNEYQLKARNEKIKAKESIKKNKAATNHIWYLARGKKRQEELIKTPEYKAAKKTYYDLHQEEILAYKAAYRKEHKEKLNQKSKESYYRKKEKNAKLLSITTDATPIDGSSSVGMLADLPEYINTEDQNNAMVTAKTCEMEMVV
jgi:hypothetical protein